MNRPVLRLALSSLVWPASVGCETHHAARETTLSRINTAVDDWDAGGPTPPSFRDAWGREVRLSVEHGPVHDVLTIRSVGPDGLPKNSDDLVRTRRRTRAGETASGNLGREVGRAGVEAARGLAKGVREKFPGGERDD